MIRRWVHCPIVCFSAAAALLSVADRVCFAQPNPSPIFAPSFRIRGFEVMPRNLGTKPPAAAPSGGVYRPFPATRSKFRGVQQRGSNSSWYFPFAWSTQFNGPMWLPENFPFGVQPGPKSPTSQNSGAGLRGNAPRRVATTLGQGNLRLGSQWPAAQWPAAQWPAAQDPARQRSAAQQPTDQPPPDQPPSRIDPHAPRPADRGVLEILLPSPNSVVSLDDVKVVGTGDIRALVTPVIESQSTYLYRVVATWFKDGKLTTAVREGPILPGELVVVDFTDEATLAAPDDAKTPHRDAPDSQPGAQPEVAPTRVDR